MTVFNFPDTTGQPIDGSFTWTAPSGVLYVWNGEAWVTQGSGGSSGGGSKVYVTDDLTTIADPEIGDLAYHTVEARLYVYYQDSDSQQWVDASPAGDANDAGGDSLWNRVGSTLSPAFTGDDIETTGDLSANSAVLTANATGAAIDVKNAQDSSKRTFLVTGSGDVQVGDDLSSDPKVSLGHDGNILTRTAGAGAAIQVRNSADDSTKVNIYGSGDVHIGGTLPASPAITLSASGSITATGNIITDSTSEADSTLRGKVALNPKATSNCIYVVDQNGTTTFNVRKSGAIETTNGATLLGNNNTGNPYIEFLKIANNRGAIYFRADSGISSGSSAIGFYSGPTPTGSINYTGSTTFFLEPEDPANFNAEGEYTGPTLDVKDRLLNLISRLDALEANEVIDDATDTSLLTLLANASTRLDSIEARLTALEGGN